MSAAAPAEGISPGLAALGLSEHPSLGLTRRTDRRALCPSVHFPLCSWLWGARTMQEIKGTWDKGEQ